LPAVIYALIALKMYAYTSQIAAFLQTRSIRRLKMAMMAQESFWKFVGIIVILCLAAVPFVFIFGFVTAPFR